MSEIDTFTLSRLNIWENIREQLGINPYDYINFAANFSISQRVISATYQSGLSLPGHKASISYNSIFVNLNILNYKQD